MLQFLELSKLSDFTSKVTQFETSEDTKGGSIVYDHKPDSQKGKAPFAKKPNEEPKQVGVESHRLILTLTYVNPKLPYAVRWTYAEVVGTAMADDKAFKQGYRQPVGFKVLPNAQAVRMSMGMTSMMWRELVSNLETKLELPIVAGRFGETGMYLNSAQDVFSPDEINVISEKIAIDMGLKKPEGEEDNSEPESTPEETGNEAPQLELVKSDESNS